MKALERAFHIYSTWSCSKRKQNLHLLVCPHILGSESNHNFFEGKGKTPVIKEIVVEKVPPYRQLFSNGGALWAHVCVFWQENKFLAEKILPEKKTWQKKCLAKNIFLQHFLAVGSWQVVVGSWQLAVGRWQLAGGR